MLDKFFLIVSSWEFIWNTCCHSVCLGLRLKQTSFLNVFIKAIFHPCNEPFTWWNPLHCGHLLLDVLSSMNSICDVLGCNKCSGLKDSRENGWMQYLSLTCRLWPATSLMCWVISMSLHVSSLFTINTIIKALNAHESWNKTGGIWGHLLANRRNTQLSNWTHAQTQICWLVLWPLPRLRCSVAKAPVAFQLSVCPSLLICCLSTGQTLILWRGLGPTAPRKGFTVHVSQGPIKTSYLW